MHSIKNNIPNLITIGNLFCGLIAIILSFENNLYFAGAFVFFGAILDFFDGLSARLLNVSSKIGKQLDSMADMVTFGVAPGIILFQLIYQSKTGNFYQSNIKDEFLLISLVGLLIPIFAAIRLSKFNVDVRKDSSFIGLPTPAAAIFIASLPIISEYYKIQFTNSIFFIGISIILSLLLIAKLPLFSLKIKKGENLKNKDNIIRIIFLISCVILLFIIKVVAVPFIVILYIFLSIINNLTK